MMFMICLNSEKISIGRVEKNVSLKESAYLRWAPGDGYIYCMIVSKISEETGSEWLVSLKAPCVDVYISYPLSLTGFYHHSYISEKWGKYFDDRTIIYFTALLNWTLDGCDDYSYDYANKLMENL